jgi:hypothetical protein
MANHKTRMWTHGVSVILQSPDKFNVERYGWGAAVTPKSANAEGWFHFAIPTPTRQDSNQMITNDIFVSLIKENGAILKQVTLHVEQDLREFNSSRITDRFWESKIATDSMDAPISDDRVEEDALISWDIKDVAINGPMNICLWLNFPTVTSRVIFRGVGAQFAESGTIGG